VATMQHAVPKAELDHHRMDDNNVVLNGFVLVDLSFDSRDVGRSLGIASSC
jgi:hypothetical protein